jgi:hypothetical protein
MVKLGSRSIRLCNAVGVNPEYDAPPLPAQTTRSNHSTRRGHLQVAPLTFECGSEAPAFTDATQPPNFALWHSHSCLP